MNIEEAQERYNKRISKLAGKSKNFADNGAFFFESKPEPRAHKGPTSRFKSILTRRHTKKGQVTIGSW